METEEPSNTACDDLRDLLSGRAEEVYFLDIEDCRQHWSRCSDCRNALPEAINHLNYIEAERSLNEQGKKDFPIGSETPLLVRGRVQA